jgi:hypothetical protein
MQRKWLTLFLAVAALLCAAATASADIKIKSRMSTQGQGYESTTYIKKSRQRTEQDLAGMSMANILQCDLSRSIQLNDRARTYLITPFGDSSSTTAAPPSSRGLITSKPDATKSGATRKGGVVTMTYTVTDTGERKQMFGLTARHLKTVMTMESSPDACAQVKTKMEMDGWYVDLDYGLECEWTRGGGAGMAAGRPDCLDEYRQKTVGKARLGYALLQTTTMFDDSGREISKITTEVIELTTTALDPALFDIPAGYTEAKNAQEFYAGAVTSSMPSTRRSNEESATGERVTGGASASTTAAAVAAGTVAAATPKKAGAIRIGIVLPRTQMSDNISGAAAAEAVRNTFVGYLNGSSVEVVLLNARMAEQAMEEARQAQCDYVLSAGLTQKKGGGLFGKVVGGVAGAAASSIPYGGSAGEVAARTTLYTTASIATSIKAKDELTLDYKLQTVEGEPKTVATNTSKAKAKSDGEDVITPMIERASAAMLAVAKK